jgi:excisionase family DNA binding protein
VKKKVFFTVIEVAQRLNRHVNTIRNYTQKGILPVVRLGRKINIPVIAVLEYEAKQLYRKIEDREKYIRESLADLQEKDQQNET